MQKGEGMRAIRSTQVHAKASVGHVDGDVTRPKNINIRLKAKQFNLLTSTSFFFLVMLFFWSFSGWGAALLTGGLERRVARNSTAMNKKPQDCLPSTVS